MPILWPTPDDPRSFASGEAGGRLGAIVASWKVPRGGSASYAELPTDGRIVTIRIAFEIPGVGRAGLEMPVTEALVRDGMRGRLESSLHDHFNALVARLLRREAGISRPEYKVAFVAWLKGRATPDQVQLLDRVNEFGADDLGLPTMKRCRCGKPATGGFLIPDGILSIQIGLCDECLGRFGDEKSGETLPPPEPESWRDRMMRDPTCTEPT